MSETPGGRGARDYDYEILHGALGFFEFRVRLRLTFSGTGIMLFPWTLTRMFPARTAGAVTPSTGGSVTRFAPRQMATATAECWAA
jgi:hypothetical protein